MFNDTPRGTVHDEIKEVRDSLILNRLTSLIAIIVLILVLMFNYKSIEQQNLVVAYISITIALFSLLATWFVKREAKKISDGNTTASISNLLLNHMMDSFTNEIIYGDEMLADYGNHNDYINRLALHCSGSLKDLILKPQKSGDGGGESRLSYLIRQLTPGEQGRNVREFLGVEKEGANLLKILDENIITENDFIILKQKRYPEVDLEKYLKNFFALCMIMKSMGWHIDYSVRSKTKFFGESKPIYEIICSWLEQDNVRNAAFSDKKIITH